MFALPLALVACGDDEVKPGSLDVQWAHPSTASCESRHIVTLEARAIKGGEVKASGTSSCPAAEKSGTITLSDLEPGTYRIEVEGFDVNDKGTYLGVKDKQTVSEGKVTPTGTIQLGQKPVFVNVDWTLPGGKTCAGAGVAEVEVTVIYNAGGSAEPTFTDKVGCNNEVTDPRGGSAKLAGVVFESLEPNDDVSIVAVGYDADDEPVAQKQLDDLVFTAGDEVMQTLALEACPGTPPVCP
ncbi:MAG: hypothetical protein IT385_01110 [Deltaproteobacteria bacterium]|nr:hypothetical protein [Deltaproteobacteria bacterium]